MTTTLRIDDNLKRQCDEVFSELGLTMTSALTVFLKQVVRTRSIPFVIGECRLPFTPQNRIRDGLRAWDILERNRNERIANGEREWTLDEINAEIKDSRQKHKVKKAKIPDSDCEIVK